MPTDDDNRKSSADLNAGNDANVGGDVVGRDKLEVSSYSLNLFNREERKGQESQELEELYKLIDSLSDDRANVPLANQVYSRLHDSCTYLDEENKGRLLRYLYNRRLIRKRGPVISVDGFDLSGAILTVADLRDANLSGVNLRDADLSDAVLSGANLSQAKLAGTVLTNAQLVGTDLSDADLTNTRFSLATQLDGAVLTIEIAGQVKAGIEDPASVEVRQPELIRFNEMKPLKGKLYQFEVIGDSMKDDGIPRGHYVVVVVNPDYSPSETDLVITHYRLSKETDNRVTLKFYRGQTQQGLHRLESRRKKIHAEEIGPVIGKVVAKYRPMRPQMKPRIIGTD